MIKAQKLREMLQVRAILRIAGAHDGLTAKLVERSGFDGVWASGLEISTSYAVPDANILTMTQFLERAIEMNDATSIPVIADCDTGFGNSNNVIHMVKQYEAAGIAAVCIEDKLFPKVNSFIPGRQELATVAEFVGKIMAAKNAQRSDEFMVIARVEALIAGWGMEEALRRANAYAEAGADAILIHSKAPIPEEIHIFAKSWENRAPLIVVPTTYSAVTVKDLETLGIKVVIYANHGIRASVKAVSETLSQIRELGSSRPVEGDIATMKEIFDLQDMPKMKEQEACYLKRQDKLVAVIPAAGDHLEEYSMKSISSDIPISMLDINGKPLLQRQREMLVRAGVTDVVVVAGYKRKQIKIDGVKIVDNPRYGETGILHSVMCAREHLAARTLVVYGDILFDEHVIGRLLRSEKDITIVVCRPPASDGQQDRRIDYVVADAPPVRGRRTIHVAVPGCVRRIGSSVAPADAHYEFPGIVALSRRGADVFARTYAVAAERCPRGPFHSAPSFATAGVADLIQEIVDQGQPVHCIEIDSGWLEIHSMDDYRLACSMVREAPAAPVL